MSGRANTATRTASLRADITSRRAALLRELHCGGSLSGIGKRFGCAGSTVRNYLGLPSKRQAAIVAVDEDGEPLPPPLSTLPRRYEGPEHDPRPELGDPELPGYAAWQLVHVDAVPLRRAAVRLGLRFPSEVLDLLAQHKRALEARPAPSRRY